MGGHFYSLLKLVVVSGLWFLENRDVRQLYAVYWTGKAT